MKSQSLITDLLPASQVGNKRKRKGLSSQISRKKVKAIVHPLSSSTSDDSGNEGDQSEADIESTTPRPKSESRKVIQAARATKKNKTVVDQDTGEEYTDNDHDSSQHSSNMDTSVKSEKSVDSPGEDTENESSFQKDKPIESMMKMSTEEKMNMMLFMMMDIKKEQSDQAKAFGDLKNIEKSLKRWSQRSCQKQRIWSVQPNKK